MKLKVKGSIILPIIWTNKFKLPAFLANLKLSCIDSANQNYQ